MDNINPVTGDPLPVEDKYSDTSAYDMIEGSGSVRGTTKPRRRKHAAEISCVSWVVAIFSVGVASILLGIFLTFFATIQTVQAGLACMILFYFLVLFVIFICYSSSHNDFYAILLTTIVMCIGTFIVLVSTCIGRYKGNVNPNDPNDSDDD